MCISHCPYRTETYTTLLYSLLVNNVDIRHWYFWPPNNRVHFNEWSSNCTRIVYCHLSYYLVTSNAYCSTCAQIIGLQNFISWLIHVFRFAVTMLILRINFTISNECTLRHLSHIEVGANLTKNSGIIMIIHTKHDLFMRVAFITKQIFCIGLRWFAVKRYSFKDCILCSLCKVWGIIYCWLFHCFCSW